MTVRDYEMPVLFDASRAQGEHEGTASASNGSVEPSDSMLFLMQLGDGDVDEEQVEAALSDRPSFRWTDAQGSLEGVSHLPEMLLGVIVLGVLVVLLLVGLALIPS